MEQSFALKRVKDVMWVLAMAGQTRIGFDPNQLVSLEGQGTVYPTLRVTDAWGVLEVSDGALLSWQSGTVRVEAPKGGADRSGPGWVLSLEPGWTLEPGERDGDWKLVRE